MDGRRSIYLPLAGSDQAREAFQTTQRTFLSVELQGKLYATVCTLTLRTVLLESKESKNCSVVSGDSRFVP